MFVYLTLTGTARPSKCSPDSTLRACRLGPTGLNPDPAEFAEFAGAAARRYADRVKWYGIWNEPNVRGWLQGSEGEEDREVVPARLYRRLYRAAAAEIRAGDPVSRLFIGELSSGFRTGVFEHFHGDPLEARRHEVTAADFLREVLRPADSDDYSLDVDAVSWHPYQDDVPPTRPRGKPGSNCGKGVSGGRRSASGCGRRNLGMGEVPRIQILLDNLHHETGISGERWLKREVDGVEKRPLLYLTEFGYRNRPGSKPGRGYWHDEKTRASWLKLALTRAKDHRARWLLLYHATELRPDNAPPRPDVPCEDRPPRGRPWDSGLFGCPNAIGGIREYGKGRYSDIFRNPQRRQAYRAIWEWADDEGYPVIDNGCPQILAEARSGG